MESLGNRIKAVREAAGLSQTAFGKYIGISKCTIYYYEHNQRIPLDSVMADISAAFGVSESWLRDGKGELKISEEWLSRSSEHKDRLIGKRFGRLIVTGHSDRPYYYICKCDCGKEKEVYQASLISGRTTSCGCYSKEAAHRRGKQAAENNAKNIKIGEVINGFLVVGAHPSANPKYKGADYVVICPYCKKEFTTKLVRLKKIRSCEKCAAGSAGYFRNIRDITAVNGSSLMAVNARVSGTTNKNSKTGVNGVSKSKRSGKYRAYIYFQRKQIMLGEYDTVEEAAAVRKEAEQSIYSKYLDENAGWKDRLKSVKYKANKDASE